jgi:TPP-dependent pyruvate/acetoin dehydrogenase alpha subunit
LSTEAQSVAPATDTPGVSRETRLALFRLMLLQRLTEERIMVLYRQGRIAGSVYTGYMQEAVAAGAGLALGPDDVAAPLNREQACHFARGVSVGTVLAQFLGRATGPTKGRDGNMHFGYPERGIFPVPSMLGNTCPIVVGAALAFKRRGEPRVALTFLGDGATSTGDVHEGFNLAAVWQVPAVFVIQNNQFAYSTPTSKQMANTNISERIRGGWSIPCERVDGTDATAMYDAAWQAVERARAGAGPQALEAVTIRGHGHAAHDGALYVGAELRARFADPIERLAVRLELDGLTEAELGAHRDAAAEEVAAGLTEAETAPPPDPSTLGEEVYASPL